MGYIFRLSYEDGIQLIKKAFQKCEEEKAWQMWLCKYSYMDKKSFVPFSKFLKQIQNPNSHNNNLNKDEIIAMAEKIKAIHQGKAGDVIGVI